MHLCGRFNKLRDQFNNSTLNTPCASRTLHTTNSKTFTPSTRFPWLASELLHHALAFPPLREIPLSPSAPRICILLVGGKKEWRPNLKSRKRRFHRFQLQFQRRQTPRRAERRSGIWWRTRWRGDCSTSPPSRSMAVSQVYMITAPGLCRGNQNVLNLWRQVSVRVHNWNSTWNGLVHLPAYLVASLIDCNQNTKHEEIVSWNGSLDCWDPHGDGTCVVHVKITLHFIRSTCTKLRVLKRISRCN